MAKLLIVAYYYPPVHVVAAQRIGCLAASAEKHFTSVHVISSQNRLHMPTEAGLAGAHIPVVNVQAKDLRYYVLARHGRATRNQTNRKDKRRFPLPLAVSTIFHSYPFHILLGDGGPLYVSRAYREACRLIQQEGITHVFSSFGPWADHRVVRRLKQRFPHLRWWADFRDLPVDPFRRNVWWPALQRGWAKRMLRNADLVSTVSTGLARQLGDFAPNVQILRNAVWQLPAAYPSTGPPDSFRITYTGSLYPKWQSANLLFRILRTLIDTGHINPVHLQLRYAGKDVAVWKDWTGRAGLQHLSEHHSVIPRARAAAWQKDTHFNLLLSWSAPNYHGILTAKLYDYLSAARPIIALVNGPMDEELQTILQETNGGRIFSLNCPSAKADLQNWIMEAYTCWQFSAAYPWAINRPAVEKYAWPQVMKAFVEKSNLLSL